jgi:hypothetical protein
MHKGFDVEAEMYEPAARVSFLAECDEEIQSLPSDYAAGRTAEVSFHAVIALARSIRYSGAVTL